MTASVDYFKHQVLLELFKKCEKFICTSPRRHLGMSHTLKRGKVGYEKNDWAENNRFSFLCGILTN